MTGRVFAHPVETFEHHVPEDRQLPRIERVRAAFTDLRDILEQVLTSGSCSGRYAALSGTALEEACMWAVKSIVFERYNG